MLYVSICMIWQWNSFFVETTQATERERGKENEQNEVKKRSRYAERDRVWISDAIEYDNTQIQLMVSAMKWISTRTSSSFFLSFFFSVVQIAAKSWNHRFLCDAYKFDLLRFDLRFFSVLRFWMPGGLSTILLRMNLCTVEFSFIPGQSEAKTDRERMRLLCGTPGEWHSNQRLNNFCAAFTAFHDCRLSFSFTISNHSISAIVSEPALIRDSNWIPSIAYQTYCNTREFNR